MHRASAAVCRRAARRWPRLAAVALLSWLAAGAAAQPAESPAEGLLRVQVRDTAPSGKPSFDRRSDRSFTVSTGGGGEDRDESPAGGAGGNGTVVSTGSAVRELRLQPGEAVRVDLPAVQSLQFHVPRRAAGGQAAGAAAAAGPASAEAGAGGASGVVAFEAIAAFAARFWLRGDQVTIALQPLQGAGVQAPGSSGGQERAGPIWLHGRVGQWIALGDTNVPARSLSPTPTPVSPASVWVRVYPSADGEPPPAKRGAP